MKFDGKNKNCHSTLNHHYLLGIRLWSERIFPVTAVKTDHGRGKKNILILRRAENKARGILLISIYANERKQI